MTRVILTEFNGAGWLVAGTEYIDAFLINRLPPDVSIEIVACQSNSEFEALWAAHDGSRGFRRPWAIHPEIMARTRGIFGGLRIVFSPWSAALDDNAARVLDDAAGIAARQADDPVILQVIDMADQPKGMSDLTNLRCTLIENALVAKGVDAVRMIRVTRPVPDSAPADEISIVYKTD